MCDLEVKSSVKEGEGWGAYHVDCGTQLPRSK